MMLSPTLNFSPTAMMILLLRPQSQTTFRPISPFAAHPCTSTAVCPAISSPTTRHVLLFLAENNGAAEDNSKPVDETKADNEEEVCAERSYNAEEAASRRSFFDASSGLVLSPKFRSVLYAGCATILHSCGYEIVRNAYYMNHRFTFELGGYRHFLNHPATFLLFIGAISPVSLLLPRPPAFTRAARPVAPGAALWTATFFSVIGCSIIGHVASLAVYRKGVIAFLFLLQQCSQFWLYMQQWDIVRSVFGTPRECSVWFAAMAGLSSVICTLVGGLARDSLPPLLGRTPSAQLMFPALMACTWLTLLTSLFLGRRAGALACSNKHQLLDSETVQATARNSTEKHPELNSQSADERRIIIDPNNDLTDLADPIFPTSVPISKRVLLTLMVTTSLTLSGIARGREYYASEQQLANHHVPPDADKAQPQKTDVPVGNKKDNKQQLIVSENKGKEQNGIPFTVKPLSTTARINPEERRDDGGRYYASNNYELVIRASKELEAVLDTQFAAEHGGLHKKITSVQNQLPYTLVADLRYLATVRNKLVHRQEFVMPSRRLFIETFERTQEQLRQLAELRK